MPQCAADSAAAAAAGTMPVAATAAPGFELDPDAEAPELEAAVEEVVGITLFFPVVVETTICCAEGEF